MDRNVDERAEVRFSAYVGGLGSELGHADRIGPLRDYCTGLILPGERKSVEPMAAKTAPARTAAQHQSLLHFIGVAAWSDERVRPSRRPACLPDRGFSGRKVGRGHRDQPLLCIHAIRPLSGMKQRGWGRIVDIASAHSLVASPFQSTYVAAKHGIAGLTKTVALELAQSTITCNSIALAMSGLRWWRSRFRTR